MEIGAVKEKAVDFIKKYRYVILVLLVGIALMLIPENEEQEITTVQTETVNDSQALETRLEDVLSQINGAGQVRVVLTTISQEEMIYQTDQDGEGKRVTTVTVSDGQRNETGLVRQVISPKYRGAVVVCQGADDPVVRLAIVEAVSNATGLGSDRISVLKMK